MNEEKGRETYCLGVSHVCDSTWSRRTDGADVNGQGGKDSEGYVQKTPQLRLSPASTCMGDLEHENEGLLPRRQRRSCKDSEESAL